MYAKLDELILARIRTGFSTFAMINAGDVRQEAGKLATLQNDDRAPRDQVDDWRLVDRRLQALRKKSEITYDRKAGWAVKEN